MIKKIHNFLIDNAVSVALSAFALVVFSYPFNFYYFHEQHSFSDKSGDWGTFGDFVGGTLNPFLSFLALVILLRTFSMQRKELSLQRKELKKTKALLKKQTETQAKQQFESTFFALFNLHNKILSDVLESNKLQKETNQIWTSLDLKSIQDSLKNAKLWKQYARNLYSLLKFIDNSSLKQNEICVYVSMIKALLIDSVLELLLIEYTVDNNLKELIDKYALFQNAHFNKSNEILEASVLAGLIHTRVYDAKKLCDDKAFGL